MHLRCFVKLLLAASLAAGAESTDIEFARPGGVPLTLDAHVPDGKGPFPAVIIVHGGGWVAGAKRTYVPPLFQPLSDAGFAWFTIDYRLAPQHPYPAALDDVISAILWVKQHAREYKADPKRIALMGESAGGHLVAMAGVTRNKAARVRAVVDFYGLHDFLTHVKDRGEIAKSIQAFLGVTSVDEAGAAKMREASPVTHVRAGLPPFLFIHGTKDVTVPFEQSTLMCEALKKSGNRCEIYAVEGAAHGVTGWEKSADFQGYKRKMVEWLRETLR